MNGGEIAERVKDNDDINYGYDLRGDRYGDMIRMGVVDSYLVVKQALDDGVSLGCMLLSTDVSIV